MVKVAELTFESLKDMIVATSVCYLKTVYFLSTSCEDI